MVAGEDFGGKVLADETGSGGGEVLVYLRFEGVASFIRSLRVAPRLMGALSEQFLYGAYRQP